MHDSNSLADLNTSDLIGIKQTGLRQNQVLKSNSREEAFSRVFPQQQHFPFLLDYAQDGRESAHQNRRQITINPENPVLP
jgi:hypothetical protein